MDEFIKASSDYSLISKETPLISNLNMLENIALIKEFHDGFSIVKAEKDAHKQLDKIDMSHIELRRATECTSTEIFYIMLIRALMTKELNVIIVSPFSLLDNIRDIEVVLKDMNILNTKKNIFLIDDTANAPHYKGYSCNIIK